MAREAAKQAMTALTDGDQIGVLVFNDKQQWLVPMTVIEGQATRDQINAAIDELTADSGTEVYPAMRVGLDAIRAVDVDVRHVILLSDGKSSSGYQRELSITDRRSGPGPRHGFNPCAR